MKPRNIGGYDVYTRTLNNGWYELSTMATSMGEEYRERQVFDHQPTTEDYQRFIRVVDSNK